jgi:acid phosphatase (class A)
MAANDAICTPSEEASLRKDGSYPSGHAALGWAWGLVLTEVAPERANALAQRAYAFGQSRVVCGVHWQSDVDTGRLVASVAVAQLHANAEFNAQLAEARKEYLASRAAGAAAPESCALEAAALAK